MDDALVSGSVEDEVSRSNRYEEFAEDDMAAWETVDYPTFIVGSAVEHAQQARLTQALEEQEM